MRRAIASARSRPATTSCSRNPSTRPACSRWSKPGPVKPSRLHRVAGGPNRMRKAPFLGPVFLFALLVVLFGALLVLGLRSLGALAPEGAGGLRAVLLA